MSNTERLRATHVISTMTDGPPAKHLSEQIRMFLAMEHVFLSATREIITKLDNLNAEFKHSRDHNPIRHIMARIKTPERIIAKLKKRGHEVSVDSAREHINDMAGIRVICAYIDDIYLVARLLTSQDDIELLRTIDYIQHPKPNGYRSLHLIVTVPVFLSSGVLRVKVEVQIRTIAMDFWASLEHELSYRHTGKSEAILRELKDCADVIANTDVRMQKLYSMLLPSVEESIAHVPASGTPQG